jgi:uroporphyrinogen decarboxylase
MTSKERFNCICNFQIPDRFPIDYLAFPEVNRKMFEFYGLKDQDDLLKEFEVDFHYLTFRDISQNESAIPYYFGPKLNFSEDKRTCPFGIIWKRGAYNDKFKADTAIEGPLKNATTEKEILSHSWPKPEWFKLDILHQEIEDHNDKVIIGGSWSGIFGDSYRMVGFENFLLNMALNPELIKCIVNRMTEFYLSLNDKIFSELKEKIDIWFWGNDFGSQQGLLFQEEMFVDYFFNNIIALNNLAKSYGIKIMMHSCGSIKPIIPFLIEAGVDILDPIQVTASDMVPEDLETRFGKQLVFHGGIDTQYILPGSNPENVYDHCLATMKTLGKNGGYIFAPSQILQGDIPPENIDSMYAAARIFRPDSIL